MLSIDPLDQGKSLLRLGVLLLIRNSGRKEGNALNLLVVGGTIGGTPGMK